MKPLEARILAAGLAAALTLATFCSHAAPGDVDTSFVPGSGVLSRVYSMALQPDGRVVAYGQTTYDCDNYVGPPLIRFNADGIRDASFDSGAGPDGGVNSMALQPDG